MRKKIYISGQITGMDYDIAWHTFKLAENYLRDSIKAYPVNPMSNGLPANASWLQHMQRDITLLMQCEEVYMLKGWEQSKGARIEYELAKLLGYTVLVQR